VSLDEDIGLLARVGLFQGFSSDQLRLLAFGAERENLRRGNLLFAEGDEAGGGYVVSTGQIDLIVKRGTRQVPIESITRGGLIGEMAMIATTHRVTDAVARVDTEVLYISRSLFHRMLREYADTAAFLHGRIAQSVRALMAQVGEVNVNLSGVPALAELQGLADSEMPDLVEQDDPPAGPAPEDDFDKPQD